MKSKITFLLLFTVSLVNAQVEFEDHLVIDNSKYVPAMDSFSADLDGDGDKDIVSSTYSNNTLVWLENTDGTGGDFTIHTISSTIQVPWGVYAADLDGDGDMDVVAASSTVNNIIWYENTDGHGTFVLKQATYAYQANRVMAADMDNDSDLDLVWSSQSDGTISWLKNTNGLGTFSGGATIETNVSTIMSFYPADMDGDGDTDVVSCYSIDGGGQGISWYKNNGTGTNFGSRLLISNAISYATSVYAGDMDGDGDMDVVSASGGDDKIAWYKNTNGLGVFGAQQVLTLTAENASVVRLADVDGDNDLDVVFGSNDDFTIGWFKNTDGLGNFSNEIFISSHLGVVRYINFTDMDADGDLDFVTGIDGDLKVFKNTDGLGTFVPKTITKHIDGGRIVVAADLDGDGDKDIAAASYWDDKITWYENLDGQGNFYDTQRIISNTLDGATSVFAGDVDGDGDSDILATSRLSNDVVLYKNLDGHGNFGPAQTIDPELYLATRVFLSDIDNDGDLDIFAIGTNRIAWYRNLDGQGNFSSQILIDSIGNFSWYELDFADLDGDGDRDLALTGSYGLYYYFNLNGLGTFGTRQTIQGYPYAANAAKIADLDNDGDKDIVYTGENINTSDPTFLGWSKNNGLGGFGPIQVITTLIVNPQSLIVADFDNDGDLDIACADAGNGGVITWYKNTDGHGNFTNTQQIVSQISDAPNDIVAADIDGNDTIDIVSIGEDDKIVWHKNTILPTSNSIHGIVHFDVLGDGCTETDAVISSMLVVATDSSGTNATFTQENGEFQIYTAQEGIVTTQITSQLPTYYTPSPATYESNFTGLGNNEEVNFCMEPIAAINDLVVAFYPTINDPRPGFNTGYRIVYRNVGTTQLSGTVTFQFDGSKINFLNASAPLASQSANTLTFDVTGLKPFEIKTIDLLFNVFAPPVTNIGNFLMSTATINPVSGDLTPNDNVSSLSQRVESAYDPNDITCLEGNNVLIEDADKYLHYLVRFQNTGTASAINVRVNDVLDSKLDWTTMQLESLSHPGKVTIHNGSEVNFIFDGINLPDSTHNEPGSHGFIAYKIKPLNNVVVGDVIRATANIYFDFNPAVVTNTASTLFVDLLSVDDFDSGKVTIYPNPTDGILNIGTDTEIAKIEIYNNLGQLILSVKETSKVDLSSLSQGIYMMTLRDVTGATFTKKVIKK